MAAPRVQIFGHSYVRRLKSFIQDSTDKTFTFGLAEPILVQFTGLPGASIPRLRLNLDLVRDFDPHFVIVLAGTNDLYAEETDPVSVTGDFMSLVHDITQSVPSVLTSVVCQIFHRTEPRWSTRYPVDLDWFNTRVDTTNRLLSVSLPSIGSHLWRCNGFWSPAAKALSFSGDGVHLSDHGQNRLYHNLKSAIVSTLRTHQS